MPRWIIWIIAGLILATLVVPSLMGGEEGERISYTEFIAAVDEGRVAEVTINNGNGEIDEGFPDIDEDGEKDCVDNACDVDLADPV
mgnify:CR=1 FL=1